MVINQGDVFWINFVSATGSGPAFRHPSVVVQNNLFNHSRINTVVVCVITSNLIRAQSPANVLLRQGEANLPKASVVNVSQIYTIDKGDFIQKIGTLSPKRMRQILDGIHLLMEPSLWS